MNVIVFVLNTLHDWRYRPKAYTFLGFQVSSTVIIAVAGSGGMGKRCLTESG